MEQVGTLNSSGKIIATFFVAGDKDGGLQNVKQEGDEILQTLFIQCVENTNVMSA